MKLIRTFLLSLTLLAVSASELQGTTTTRSLKTLAHDGTETLYMYKASKRDKPILSKADVTLDCGKQVMCVEVKVVHPGEYLSDHKKPDEHYVKINGQKMAEAFEGDFIKNSKGQYIGWNVCFPTKPFGDETLLIKVHANVWEDGESQTSATPGDESLCLKCNGGGGGGDPHFKTWSGHDFDYHGACDLKLLESKNFGQELGLEVQIRTEQQDWYSFISDVAIRIGNEILEVGRNGNHYLNGVKNAELSTSLSGFPLTYYATKIGEHYEHVYEIHIGEFETEILRVRAFKDFLYVDFLEGVYSGLADSIGLMGDWNEGKMLARDGATEMEEWVFGPEWQVRDDEEMLFQISRAPQYPVKCTPPIWEQEDAKVSHQVVKESSLIDRSAAEAACEHWSRGKNKCIADVMATGDLDLAALDS